MGYEVQHRNIISAETASILHLYRDIVRIKKYTRIRWAGHVPKMKETSNARRIWW
jgi:hypothetical protein